MSNNEKTKTPSMKRVETTKFSRMKIHCNVKDTEKIENKRQVFIPCYKGKRLVELEDIERIEKFKNKTHGYRYPPKNVFFTGDTKGSFIIIPVKRRKFSWLFKNPLNDTSTEVIFRFFKKNINILNHNDNLRIKYKDYCEKFKEKYGESKISYKDLALKRTIEELIIASLRKKKHTIASYFKIARKQRKVIHNSINRDRHFYRLLGLLVEYVDYMFYELEFLKGTKDCKELFFAINFNTLTSTSSDPTKKWTTRIDLFDDIRVVKQMPTEYFPYNSRVGIIDLTQKLPFVKTITLSKSTQFLEITKCKQDVYDNCTDNISGSKQCYAVCLKKLR